jgi:hypothetical protein
MTLARTAPALLTTLTLLISTAAGAADQCGSCAFFDCLSSVIKHKEAIRTGYDELATKWDQIAKRRGGYWVSSGQVPRDVIDLESLPQRDRATALAALRADQAQFGRDEEQMTSTIGAPAGCGFDGAQNLEISTETVTACAIDMVKAKAVELAVPCKDLYEIAMQHEAIHVQMCNTRKARRIMPAKLQTASGKAREEVQAYEEEIPKIKDLIRISLNESFPISIDPASVIGGATSNRNPASLRADSSFGR